MVEVTQTMIIVLETLGGVKTKTTIKVTGLKITCLYRYSKSVKIGGLNMTPKRHPQH